MILVLILWFSRGDEIGNVGCNKSCKLLRILDLSKQLREIPEYLGAGKGVMTEKRVSGETCYG